MHNHPNCYKGIYKKERKRERERSIPEGLLTGVLGKLVLGFAMREGLENGFPEKLLLIGLLISELLGLGFDGTEDDNGDLLLEGMATKLN